MTFVSNHPTFWPYIATEFFDSYWLVAAGIVVVYDWVLTLGQEIELIWRQRWSLMTVLYLVIRYVGIPYSVVIVLAYMPLVSVTDAVSIPQPSPSYPINTHLGVSETLTICLGSTLHRCNILVYAINSTNVVITPMLGVIMIARLHAMYQRSRTMLIFLVIIFLAVNIACAVLAAIVLTGKHLVAEEMIFSGIHMCGYGYEGDVTLLASMVWMLNTVWEILALSFGLDCCETLP